jgi:hypothetical protein
METHDPMCPWFGSGDPWTRGSTVHTCACDLIHKVRADEQRRYDSFNWRKLAIDLKSKNLVLRKAWDNLRASVEVLPERGIETPRYGGGTPEEMVWRREVLALIDGADLPRSVFPAQAGTTTKEIGESDEGSE